MSNRGPNPNSNGPNGFGPGPQGQPSQSQISRSHITISKGQISQGQGQGQGSAPPERRTCQTFILLIYKAVALFLVLVAFALGTDAYAKAVPFFDACAAIGGRGRGLRSYDCDYLINDNSPSFKTWEEICIAFGVVSLLLCAVSLLFEALKVVKMKRVLPLVGDIVLVVIIGVLFLWYSIELLSLGIISKNHRNQLIQRGHRTASGAIGILAAIMWFSLSCMDCCCNVGKLESDKKKGPISWRTLPWQRGQGQVQGQGSQPPPQPQPPPPPYQPQVPIPQGLQEPKPE